MEADSIRLHKVPSHCRYRIYISSRVVKYLDMKDYLSEIIKRGTQDLRSQIGVTNKGIKSLEKQMQKVSVGSLTHFTNKELFAELSRRGYQKPKK